MTELLRLKAQYLLTVLDAEIKKTGNPKPCCSTGGVGKQEAQR